MSCLGGQKHDFFHGTVTPEESQRGTARVVCCHRCDLRVGMNCQPLTGKDLARVQEAARRYEETRR